MESEFLTDPENAHLFAETEETSVAETSEPETREAQTSVNHQKRKQPAPKASPKKRRKNSSQKNKKKEPELVSVHV